MKKGELIINTTDYGHISMQLRVQVGTIWLREIREGDFTVQNEK